MARRRMFSAELTSSDRFLSMTTSAQCFYFHLNIHADDEGFVSSPRSLGMLCGGTDENLQELENAGFIIRFHTGVLVIVDWMLNNTIRKDRSMETIHRTEKALLTLVHDRYVLRSESEDLSAEMTTNLTTNLSTNLATQNRIEKNIIEENILDHNISDQNHDDGSIPDIVMIDSYCQEHHLYNVSATGFWSHYTTQGWKDDNGEPVKDWRALLRRWDENARAEKRGEYETLPWY